MRTKIYVATSVAMPKFCRINTSNDPTSDTNNTTEHDFQPVPFSIRAVFGVDCEPNRLHDVMDDIYEELEHTHFAKDFYSCTTLEAVETIRLCLARAGIVNGDPVANAMVVLYVPIDKGSRSQNFYESQPLAVMATSVMERFGPIDRHYITAYPARYPLGVIERWTKVMELAGYPPVDGVVRAPISVAIEHLAASVAADS